MLYNKDIKIFNILKIIITYLYTCKYHSIVFYKNFNFILKK